MYNDLWGALAMSYERNSDGTWGYTYTIGFWGKKNNTPLLFGVEFWLKLLYVDLGC